MVWSKIFDYGRLSRWKQLLQIKRAPIEKVRYFIKNIQQMSLNKIFSKEICFILNKKFMNLLFWWLSVETENPCLTDLWTVVFKIMLSKIKSCDVTNFNCEHLDNKFINSADKAKLKRNIFSHLNMRACIFSGQESLRYWYCYCICIEIFDETRIDLQTD